MKVNKITIRDATEMDSYINERLFEFQPHGDMPPAVDVLDIQSRFLLSLKETNESYINSNRLEQDGIGRAHAEHVTGDDTSIAALSETSVGICIYDHQTDGYNFTKQGIEQFDISVEVNGNDIMVNDKKLFGGTNFITDDWVFFGQVKELPYDMSKYVDLPESKFNNKKVDSPDTRIGSIADVAAFEPTVDDVVNAIEHIV